ncbi:MULTISPECIES: PilC/PilY family type IV pilus protein [unclassified Pseudoxanthomonas]|uniref:pilus assembly protein n=1 Tax=unclassified Pseudoxanthomonas TaxID=2645906 RepID=UPI003077EA1E
MTIQSKSQNQWARRLSSKLGAVAIGMLAVLSSMPAVSVDLATKPLSIGADVPGNLALVPSVEFPTLISVANFGDYIPTNTYVGYFDPAKCYTYVYDAVESKRHFAPSSSAGASHACAGALWSGNYMNWAATQTIDPFRSALTGGYRVKDTVDETWLEKAKADRNGNENANANFPRRTYPGSANSAAVNSATAASWGTIRTRIDGLGNKMRFTSGGNGTALANDNPGVGQPVAYNPASHTLDTGNITVNGALVSQANVVFEVSVRVKVCVANMLEANCNSTYSKAAKPEGLIQQYSRSIRYSIFGYLNNGGSPEPDGGVMRARQKFVGPYNYYPDVAGLQLNANSEWDPATGILETNPDETDANNTNAGITNSGVINYLNKFGQMETGRNAKSFDNVSELYYTALRYFKNLGNVSTYAAVNGDYQLADGFPVITDWDDPIRYSCQANVFLGVGDTNTWKDKNLPGATSSAGEINTKDAAVSDDKSVDVVAMMKKIWQMEGKSEAEATTLSVADWFNRQGHNNSAYIAALAYDAHTRDIRPAGTTKPIEGKQTISTYWVDVVENRDYKTPHTNQYWLATKYGGFTVPGTYDPDTNTTPLTDPQWWATNEYVDPAGANYKRPANFYVAADAAKMVDSLKRVFAKIVTDMKGSGGSFASNTTKLEAGAMAFQSQFYSGSWRGELVGYNVTKVNNKTVLTGAWTAGSNFPQDWTKRKIYINNAGKMEPFTSLSQATALDSQNVVDYLRGDRTKELPAGTLRARQSVLGDIVNSQPVYVGAPNNRLFYGAEFAGADTYGAYALAQSTRDQVVYVGANDGMLHGFNAKTGVETFAFIPSAVVPRLKDYTSPDYEHQYYVDGEITVADAYIGGGWKTILVGTLGRGGRGVYALDVTNPSAVKFLWEKTSADIPDLGNVLNKPIIAQVADNDWRVLMGNGPNSATGLAQLLSIDLDNGTADVIDTPVGGDNALMGVNAWNTGISDFVDVVYAGDLKGNLWKITNLAGTPTVTSFFQASYGGTAQPITATPMVSRNPTTRQTWIHFGTGRYLNANDLVDKSVQTWYGLIDRGSAISGRTGLKAVPIIQEIFPNDSLTDDVVDNAERLIDENSAPGVDGWYIDLISKKNGVEGERMVVANVYQGLTLIGTTRVPENTDVCKPSGRGWIMAIDPFTGGRLPQPFFDTNGDGKFDSNDEGASGVGLSSGSNNQVFLGDTMLTNMDNAESKAFKTNSSVLAPARVSWREVVAD